MKKTLIALACCGLTVGIAHAQSNVTVYGIVDTGYIKQNGRDVRMGENVNNRIGFRGQEDLGNGLKATFELERRFDLFNGANRGTEWDGNANMGLAGKGWGRVRFGRMNELTTETLRKFDPFYQYGVGGMIESTLRSARISHTARYDSPSWAGLTFGASYSLGRGTGNDDGWDGRANATTAGALPKIDNDGYALNVSYNNGPWMATANWSRLADSGDSYNWNLGVAYKFFGQARVSLAYEQTRDKVGIAGEGADFSGNVRDGNDLELGASSKQQTWLLGLEWDLGPGQLDASVNYLKVDEYGRRRVHFGSDDTILKYALGYTYNLSKRTSVYGFVSYTDADEGLADRESTTAFQLGMTHKF
ncbi:MAG: porin [Burkholderiaceae bacterium]|jgi:predicted porin|nr:porin [Burkholderiaceae bacterium]